MENKQNKPNKLLDKIKKNSTIKESAILSDSKFFDKKDQIKTEIPILNVALSADINGGISPGLTLWAGPSKHFKTAFLLMMVKAYQEKYPDGVCLFYDSEFGTGKTYFDAFGIDMSRVVHSPLTDVEQLKFDIMAQLQEVERGDKLFIAIDSVGNLASKKEVEDALAQKSVTDMTRAKQIKSLFRMVTPHLNLKDIPMHVVMHIYMEQGMYPKAIISGGTGPLYSADSAFIIGRQQEKEQGETEILGYDFIINVEKSRFVKEKSKIPIEVRFDGGISQFSGLKDLAIESGHVTKPKPGWYSRVDMETGEVEDKLWRKADMNCAEFWTPILNDQKFKDWVKDTYALTGDSMYQGYEDLNIEDGDE